MEVLLFSFSISIDALGYSLGFGSKNITINLYQFIIINLINTLILTLFLRVFSKFEYLFKNNIISKLAPILLAIFGLFYVCKAFYTLFLELKQTKHTKVNSNNKTPLIFSNLVNGYNINNINNNYLSIFDFLLLFLVFVFENAFSTFVFYSTFNSAFLFVSTNFVFHFFFFVLGYNLGKKIAMKLNNHTSFVSGFIFLILAYIELFY